MLRSVIAVVVGFLYIGALSFGADAVLRGMMPGAFGADGRVESTPVLLLIIGYVALFAISGCYLTARLAPNRPLRHALVLGVLGLIFNLIGTSLAWETAPVWFHLVSVLLVMPYAYLGGRLRERELAGSAFGGARALSPT